MNSNAVWTIVRKDLKIVFQNKAVSVPLIVVPIVMLVALPALVALLSLSGGTAGAGAAGFDMTQGMPPGFLAALTGYDESERFVVALLVYMGAPLYLILPLITALSIACDSFAGEKERKTLEALLYTPTTDWELLLGKMLSAWLPGVGVAWGGFLVYTVVANLAAWPVMGRVFFPPAMWVILAVWVAPAVAGLGLGAAVLISLRARTFQAAYQLAAAVTLPILLLLAAQISGLMVLSAWLVAALGLVVWGIDAALLWLGRRSFRRSKLALQM